MKKKVFLCLFTTFMPLINIHADYGMIQQPVVDLYGSADGAAGKLLPAMSKNSEPCPRINQALFNETFQIAQWGSQATRIIIPWAIYGYDTWGKPLNSYWVETKNLFIVDEKYPHHLRCAIPHFADKKDIVTLKRPFTDIRGNTYSVGTQFVCLKKQSESNCYSVMRLNTQTNSLEKLAIPKSMAFRFRKLSVVESRKVFVTLLTDFIQDISRHKPYTIIPYVWGGGSFTTGYSDNFFEDVSGYHRIEKETVPLSGYDCSLLVLRFAHMAQVPYIFKTTATLEKFGKPFTETDTLEEGDLIWLQGHVVVITDIKNKMVTEAVGYENFLGKVRTVKLEQLLKNISTWDDLIDSYSNKRTVIRLDKFGNDYKESPVKIFKLC
ncbi:MAG: hypothetical protein K2X90_03510 [Candidatus Babeliaceae bacterium]|nr:hypothetical protein [Candidatus Babeliaceae bacterium]